MKKSLNIVIIGGGSAGINCAIKLRKLDEKVNILLVDEAETIGNSPCKIPNYLAGQVADEGIIGQGDKLLDSFFNIEVKLKHSFVNFDDSTKKVYFRQLDNNIIVNFNYDKLVIATGSKAKKLTSADSEDVYYLYTAKEAIRFKKSITKNTKQILLVGGGVMNLEFADSLAKDYEVTLVSSSNEILRGFNMEAQQLILDKLHSQNVNVLLNTTILSLNNHEAVLSNDQKISFDKCLVAIGLSFDKNLYTASGLKTLPNGQIIVNRHYETNIKDVYACGDAISYPDYSGANSSFSGSGLTAGISGRMVAEYLINKTHAKLLTNYHCFTTKLFDYEIASVGSINTNANDHNIVNFTLWQQPVLITDELLTVYVQFHKKTGKLYYASAIGKNASTVINQLAILMQINNNINLLTTLQLAYHPEINAVKTVIHNLGFMANAIMKDKCHHISPADLELNDDNFILDVRTPEEFSSGSVPRAINIPISELRHCLSEVKQNKHIIIVCEIGKRAYYASQILRASNLHCSILSGGMKSYCLIKKIKKEKI